MTLWTVFTDVSLMAGLLLVGQVLRANVKIFQKLLIPPVSDRRILSTRLWTKWSRRDSVFRKSRNLRKRPNRSDLRGNADR